MRSRTWASAVGWALVAICQDARGQCEEKQLAKVIAGDAAQIDWFGTAVAIDGGRVAVGAYGKAPDGAVYVFEQSGASWGQSAKLDSPPSGGAGQKFGHAVGLKGSILVAGAPYANVGAASKVGAATVYEHSGGVWQPIATLVASDPVSNAAFGRALSFDGKTIATSARNNEGGVVYLFQEKAGTWLQVARLVPNDPKPSAQFGESVSIDGDRLIVGAPHASGASPASGAAYVFEKELAGWVQRAKLTIPGAQSDVGMSVSICGAQAAVGAAIPYSVATFSYVAPFWIQTGFLGPADNYQFPGPLSVAMNDAVLAVGSPHDHDIAATSGAVHVFVREGDVWKERMKLKANDPQQGALYGSAVGLSGASAIVGAPEGNALVQNSGAAYMALVTPNLPPEYGVGCPGSAGAVPTLDLLLSFDGCIQAGDNLSFAISGGLGGSSVLLFFGFAKSHVSMGGGCSLLLVPSPLMVALPLLGAGSGSGSIAFSATMPLTALPGSIFGQGFIPDPGGTLGFAATNGLRVTVK